MDNTTIEAIRQRLMYSFGFSHEQAQQELAFLFAVPRQKLYTAEFYTMRVRRVGATKILTRRDLSPRGCNCCRRSLKFIRPVL